MERQDKILFVRMFDSWNLEATEHLIHELRNQAVDLKNSPWATLYDFRKWSLLVPEAMTAFRKFAHELDATNRTHSACVIQDFELANNLISNLGRSLRVNVQIFTSVKEARDWLSSEGFD